ACALFVEDVTTFSWIAAPVTDVLKMACAVYTLVTRAVEGTDDPAPIMGRPWFWICSGFALSGVLFLLIDVVSLPWVTNAPLLTRAMQLNAGLQILAMVFVTLGMLCAPAPALPSRLRTA